MFHIFLVPFAIVSANQRESELFIQPRPRYLRAPGIELPQSIWIKGI
jgi:hypothetical protein